MSAPKKLGRQTVTFSNPPVILSTAAIAGPEEGAGPLADTFDKIITDERYGENTWEKAERRVMEETLQLAVQKAGLKVQDIDYLLAGDLLNQIVSSNYAARDLEIPYIGIFSACSTMYESMALGAMLVDGGFADYVLAGTASHFATAERQFRFPVEHGNQKPLTSQKTVTGAGAMVISNQGTGPRITQATIGKALDLGQGDANHMGAVMAPAAADTIKAHFDDTTKNTGYYDLVITGDLGVYGKRLADELLQQRGIDISDHFTDCGILIYSPDQDIHAGGSGCACSAVVTCGHIYRQLNEKRFRRVLGVGTGALLSPGIVSQGETIPGLGHGVVMEML